MWLRRLALLALAPFLGAAYVPHTASRMHYDSVTGDLRLYDEVNNTAVLTFDTSESNVALEGDWGLRLDVTDTVTEIEIAYCVTGTMTGTVDLIDYDNPCFVQGRVVNGPYGPKYRFIARADAPIGERTLAEWEFGGTFAMVLAAADSRSVFEAFYESEVNPLFRLGVDNTNGGYLQWRHPSSDANDYITLSRVAATDVLKVADETGTTKNLDFHQWNNSSNGNMYLGGTLIPGKQTKTVSANAVDINMWSGNIITVDLTGATADVTITMDYPQANATWIFVMSPDDEVRNFTWKHEVGGGDVDITANILWEGGTDYTSADSDVTAGPDIVHLMYLGGTSYYGWFTQAHAD